MRILIIDDHAILREGVKEIIREDHKNAETGEAGCAAEAVDLIGREDWDAAVLDIALPDGNGLELLKKMKALRPKLPVLILSGRPEDEFAVRAIKAGASGYVTKGSSTQIIGAALKKVLSGGVYTSAELSDRIMGNLGVDTSLMPHERLSDREYLVLRMIGNGKAVSEIAEALQISVKTVGTYRMRILEKMDLHSTAELMRYAVENKLTDD